VLRRKRILGLLDLSLLWRIEPACSKLALAVGNICVAQFNTGTAKSQKLSEMKKKDAWENARYIDKRS